MSSTTAADLPLAGKSAVVTGASRGIGREIARQLAAAGAELILVARDTEAMGTLGKEMGGRFAAYSCDMAYPDIVAEVVVKIRHRLNGAPDILVNNAAQFFVTPAEDTLVEDFQRTVTVNLTSHFAFVRGFLPEMHARGSGHVVTIGSIADRQALRGNAAYVSSKFALRGLHEVLREELRGTGVRCTLVSPARVDTEIWDDVPKSERLSARAEMLASAAVADAVRFAVTRPVDVNVDELRLSRA